MPVSNAVKAGLALVMLDSILELSFVSATVGWLHGAASGTFLVNSSSGTYPLKGEPLHLMTDQGHTANAAAGTGFILIGLGGILALSLRNRSGKFGHGLYYLWLVINVLAFMLTLGALGYVMNVTNAHKGQSIDVDVASGLKGAKYPQNVWTPQNWFSAVLDLDLASESERKDILSHLRIMWGWQYNLIVMVIVQLGTTVLFIMDGLKWRKERKGGNVVGQEREKFANVLEA
jgi:hypothetical protein